MTQEDKELLLKDLCARLPYGVMCAFPNNFNWKFDIVETLKPDSIKLLMEDRVICKPYLRPMDSMTYSQQKEYNHLLKRMVNTNDADILYTGSKILTDFFNREHIDYRGLIEKGLALEAPEGMYKID